MISDHIDDNVHDDHLNYFPHSDPLDPVSDDCLASPRSQSAPAKTCQIFIPHNPLSMLSRFPIPDEFLKFINVNLFHLHQQLKNGSTPHSTPCSLYLR